MITVDTLRDRLLPLSLPDGELRDLLHALQHPPHTAIRLRPGVDPDSLPFPLKRAAWHRNAHFVQGTTRPAAFLHFGVGDYYIQDAASLLAVTALDPKPGERICDLCAAPGGKATAIVESIGDEGWLLANEAIGSRNAALCFNLARQGATQFAVCQHDPDTLASLVGPMFDAVLVDAPCSGQTLVGRGRQTLSAFSTRAVEHSAARQKRILTAAASLVAPEGRLVYSTCTYSFAENEGRIEDFLASHPEFRLEPCRVLEEWDSDVLPGCYRLWPHRHDCGGAFAATLVRGPGAEQLPRGRPARGKQAGRPTQVPDSLSTWGRLDLESVQVASDRCFGWPRPLWAPLATVCQAGPEVTFRKGRTWFPSYALAMRRHAGWQPHASVELTEDLAAEYLQGLPIPSSQAGWAVATWKGRPLGWLKGDGRIGKNHLPKAARLSISRANDRRASENQRE